MNILIITPFYKHDRNIASVRWTNIGIRLAKKHNVIVVTQPHDDMDMSTTIEKDEDNILVARINQKTGYEKTAIKHFGGATGDDWQTSAGTGEAVQVNDDFKRKLKNRILYASMRRKAKQYADDIVKKVIPTDMRIDVVISSACPFIEMLFGYELKKRLGCKWISDFRDLPFIEDNCDGTHIQKQLMRNALLQANAVITIANKGKEKLADGIVDDSNKIHVIRNGFSLTDARETTTIQDDKLHIVHTGSLYGGTRKADLLFKAVLAAREKEPDFKYVLECAGGNNESLVGTAAQYREESNIINHGFISREEALALQRSSDLLLALIYKTAGSFSAKIYEYILNKKPIICISRGSNEIGEETQFIKELQLGIAIEENTSTNDLSELADFLLSQYKRKVSGLQIDYSPKIKELERYSIDKISVEIETLCKSVLKGKVI